LENFSGILENAHFDSHMEVFRAEKEIRSPQTLEEILDPKSHLVSPSSDPIHRRAAIHSAQSSQAHRPVPASPAGGLAASSEGVLLREVQALTPGRIAQPASTSRESTPKTGETMKKITFHDDANQSLDLNTIEAEDFLDAYKNFMYKVGWDAGYDDFTIRTVIDDIALKFCCDRKHNYSPAKGKFTSYLAIVVRNMCSNEMRKNNRHVFQDEQMLDATCCENGNFSNGLAHSIRAAQCEEMLRKALEQMSEKVCSRRKMEAFTRLVIDEERPADVARNTRLDISEIYQIKAQMLPRFRTILRRLDEAC